MPSTLDQRAHKLALDLVAQERVRQHAMYGQQDLLPIYWMGLIGEEYGEYCQAVNETAHDNGPAKRALGGTQNMMRELTHIAATAIQAMECLIRVNKLRHPPAAYEMAVTADKAQTNVSIACSRCGRLLTTNTNKAQDGVTVINVSCPVCDHG